MAALILSAVGSFAPRWRMSLMGQSRNAQDDEGTSALLSEEAVESAGGYL
jgi:hypothetical protein